MDFETLLARQKPSVPKIAAVAAAEDPSVLRTVVEAAARGIATPILCGNPEAIQAAAEEARISIGPFTVVPAHSEAEAAKAAAGLVRCGKAHMLVKGLLQTSTLLKAVLDKENGLRGEGILSHVAVVHSPLLDRTLFLTDGAMVLAPDLGTKVKLIQNAVFVAKRFGIEIPRVAVLAAVEKINPDMPATLEAALLTVMNQRGQIPGCVVDGPLAMDLALSREAALHKGIGSEVAGQADILLFHTIEAANSALKVFTFAGGCLFGGLVIGAAAPIVLASRADSEQSKLYSIACGATIGSAE